MHLIALLTRPVVKAMPLIAFGPGVGLALAMGWIASRQPPHVTERLTAVRIGILAIAIACAFIFDDRAAIVTDPTPSQLRVRRLIRLITGLSLAAAATFAAIAIASQGIPMAWTGPAPEAVELFGEENYMPVGRLMLEAATIIFCALAVAAIASYRDNEEPGRIATSVLLGTYLITWMIPSNIRPWAYPGEERWANASNWLLISLAISVLLVVAFSWQVRRRAIPIRRPSASHQRTKHHVHLDRNGPTKPGTGERRTSDSVRGLKPPTEQPPGT